jgi:DNA-binding transcriptional regulator PaaX
MLIKKNLKKWLVFSLAFVFDQYKKISIKNYYRNFYFFGDPPKRESLHKLVYRMIKVKEIEKVEKEGEVYLKLTNKGGNFFNEKISLKNLSEKEWDRKWRLVIFDIKEIERNLRDKLREKLKKWGFAMWQESVYISPHPILEAIDEFLKVKKLFPKVVTLEAKAIGIKNPDRFAWVIFKLGELENKYLALKKRIKEMKKTKKNIKEIINRFQDLILIDPFLPRGLIKGNWPRDKIKLMIRDLAE